jgi:hypothetical protein
MPIIRGTNYYQWGKSGKKYYYIPGNKKSRLIALHKAQIQARSIMLSQLRY